MRHTRRPPAGSLPPSLLVGGSTSLPVVLVLVLVLVLLAPSDSTTAATKKKTLTQGWRIRRLAAEGPHETCGSASLLLSRGRGYMGAAMVDDPALILFAGGIGMEGTVVDNKVDAVLVKGDGAQQQQGGWGQPDCLMIGTPRFSLGWNRYWAREETHEHARVVHMHACYCSARPGNLN